MAISSGRILINSGCAGLSLKEIVVQSSGTTWTGILNVPYGRAPRHFYHLSSLLFAHTDTLTSHMMIITAHADPDSITYAPSALHSVTGHVNQY